MISDRALAILCEATETLPSPEWAFAGPTFHATLTRTSSGLVLACQGTETLPEWIDDFDVVGPGTFDHPSLGIIHAGFDRTTNECLSQIIGALVNENAIIVTGHSKGGAEAEMIAAKLALAGINIIRLVTFGTPRWVLNGNAKVPLLLPMSLGSSYRHTRDIVTEVPFAPFDHPATRAVVRVGMATLRQMLDARWMHSIANYVACIQN